ncbi:MAG: hypothetical protein QHH75_04560 [Bacillota bacterium]|nr:hypothetical protein [Bacillota bacterium]
MNRNTWRNLLLLLWDIWERFYSYLFHVRKIEPDGLLRLSLRPYRGPAVELRDGTVITPGELVGELHLANKELLKIQQKCNSQVKATMCVKKELKRSLVQLANHVRQKKVAEEVKAFYGITLFHQGARHLGFEVKEPPSAFLRFFFGLGQSLLLVCYHPAGLKRLKLGHHSLTPKLIWISRAALLKDFLPPRVSSPEGKS